MARPFVGWQLAVLTFRKVRPKGLEGALKLQLILRRPATAIQQGLPFLSQEGNQVFGNHRS